MSDGNPSGTRWVETASVRWLDAEHDVATACGHAQCRITSCLAPPALPGPSRRCPWPRLPLVPDPGCRQGLQPPVSSRYPSATRRRVPARHQRGRDQRHTAPAAGSAAAGQGRPGQCRPPRAIEAQPVAMSPPGTGSGLPAGPAAPGELAVPVRYSAAGTSQAPKGKGSATHRAGSGISSCWPGPPWTVPATPGHRGAARGHVSPWYRIRAAGRACSPR